MDATVVASPDHVSTTVDDEMVVLHLPTSTYHGLNGVGAHVWGQLTSPVSVDAVVASVAEAYETDAAVCEPDVRSFLADLAALELISVTAFDAGSGSDSDDGTA
jgi:hypothetical protein